jgi:hypothetical protein
MFLTYLYVANCFKNLQIVLNIMPDGALPSEPDTHPENSSGSTCGSATLK